MILAGRVFSRQIWIGTGPDEFKEGAEMRSLFPQSAKRRVAFILTGRITMVDVERLLLVPRTLWKNFTKSSCRRSEWDDVSRRKMVAVCGNQRWGGRKRVTRPWRKCFVW